MSALVSAGQPRAYRSIRASPRSEDPKNLSDPSLPIGPFQETCVEACKPADETVASLVCSAKRSQRRYKRNKKQLSALLENYSDTLGGRYPILAGYKHMLEVVNKVRDPLLKALLINGWVNTLIEYDKDEANISRRRSMTHALKDGKGVCVEMAELKLAALELAGFPSSDVRYVEEILVENGSYDSKHAIIEARIGDDIWILDSQQKLVPEDISTISPEMWITLRMFNSGIKEDDTHLNLDADAITRTYYPYKSFNSDTAGIYVRNVELWADFKMGDVFGGHDIVVAEPEGEREVELKAVDVGRLRGFKTAKRCMKKALALRYGIAPT